MPPFVVDKHSGANMAESNPFHAFLLGLRVEPATMQLLFPAQYAEWLAMHSQMHEESMRSQIRFQVNKVRRAVQAQVSNAATAAAAAN